MRWLVVPVVAILVALTGGVPRAGATAAGCAVLRVRQSGGGSLVDTVRYPGLATTPLGWVPYQLNALGYSRAQDRAYGMTGGGDVVTLDRRGEAVKLGPAVGGRWILGATSGTIAGDFWYVKRMSTLYTIDVTPDVPVVRRAIPLRPWLAAVEVDDFDYNPADGLLYGVTATAWQRGAVVALSPRTGQIWMLPGLRLPPAPAYGSVARAPDGSLYVTANSVNGANREYHVVLSGRTVVAVEDLGATPLSGKNDIAGCLGSSAPPPTTPPPSSPTTTPPPPPSTTPPPVPPSATPPPPPPAPPSATPPPAAPPPVAPPPATTTPPQPPPPPAPPPPPPPPPLPAVPPPTTTTPPASSTRPPPPVPPPPLAAATTTFTPPPLPPPPLPTPPSPSVQPAPEAIRPSLPLPPPPTPSAPGPPATNARPPSSASAKRPPMSAQKKEEKSASKSLDSTKQKRDWAVAALVLIIGGSLVARRIGR